MSVLAVLTFFAVPHFIAYVAMKCVYRSEPETLGHVPSFLGEHAKGTT